LKLAAKVTDHSNVLGKYRYLLHRFAAFLLVAVAVTTLIGSGNNVVAGSEARAPNVLFILTDDQGSVDMNVYGAKDLHTPNMDNLARQGVRFTQFYCGAPVCSASRATCLTGRNPHRAGVPNNVSSRPDREGAMPLEQITMAEMFQASGYYTAQIGKWHLGYDRAHRPDRQGFDYWFGHLGGCIDNYSHFFYWSGPNRHDLWRNNVEIHQPGKFFGDLMLSEATTAIEHAASKKQPFFMYYAINMPHYPYQGDAHWLKQYSKLPYPRNLYAAFVSTIDERLGKLMQVLKDNHVDNNTIIVLQSDHGHSAEERAHFGGGSAGPHRGHKFQLLEGGIRVPAIIRWPGVIPAGQVRTQIATAADWYPTLAAMCKLPAPAHRIDGVDISDVILSPEAKSPHGYLFWDYSGQRAALHGDWKMYADRKQVYLYNLKDDPGESQDLAAQHPAILHDLKTRHAAWSKSKASQHAVAP